MNLRLALLSGAALLILSAGIALSGQNVGEALRVFALGTVGNPESWTGTLRETTPLLIAGAGVFYALRAGLFNIGIEGQFLVGGFAATVAALRFPGPAGLVLGAVLGAAAGGLWALPAAWIKAYRGGHEVISTIMLNSIAIALTDALVAGPFRDPSNGTPSTAAISRDGMLPFFFQAGRLQVSTGLLAGIILAIGIHYWMKLRVAGYEHQAVGANPRAALYAGIDVRAVTVRAMVVSGLIGGLAGSIQSLAFEGRFYQGFSPGYGFDALGVALLAGSAGYLLIPASLLFGVLARGGTQLGIFGVPKGLSMVALGLIILVAGAFRFRKEAARD